jgi:predicted MFS family arabinose efflux permease
VIGSMAIARIALIGWVREARRAPGGGLLLAVCLAPFVALLNVFALSPFLPAISAELGIPIPLLGQVPAATMLLAGVFGVALGPLADRFGHRRALVLGLLAAAAGSLSMALAGSAGMLIAAAGFGGISRAVGQPISLAIAGAYFQGATRRRAVSFVQAGGAVSPILGVPLLATIGAAAGWRAAFLVLSLAAFGVGMLVMWLLPRDGPAPAVKSDGRSVLHAYAPLASHPPTLGLYGATFFRTAGTWAFLTYLGAFLVDRYALSASGAGALFACTGVGQLLGNLTTGSRFGNVPLRPLVVTMSGLHLVLLASVMLVPVPVGAAAVLIALAYVANGSVTVGANTLLVSESPGGRATTMSLNQTCMSVGGAVGGSLGGLLLATGGFAAMGVFFLICGAVSALAAWLTRPERQRDSTL